MTHTLKRTIVSLGILYPRRVISTRVVLWGARNGKIEYKRNVSVTMVRKYGRSPLS